MEPWEEWTEPPQQQSLDGGGDCEVHSLYDSDDTDKPEHFQKVFGVPREKRLKMHNDDQQYEVDVKAAMEASLSDMTASATSPADVEIVEGWKPTHARVDERKPAALVSAVSAQVSEAPSGANREKNFKGRLVRKGTKMMVQGDANDKAVALKVLKDLNDPNSVSNMMAASATMDGTPAVGESPAVYDALAEVQVQQIAIISKKND